jgi:hypothetical protein
LRIKRVSKRTTDMSDWIHSLPIPWMAVVIFGITYLVAAILHVVIQSLAVGDRGRAFKAVSPGLLPPIGIIFGLLVAFIAAQVWGDLDRAYTAVNREASALRDVVILAENFPGETARLRGLIRQHIQEVLTQEWPAMAQRRATIRIIPTSLVQAMQISLASSVQGEGQAAAQRAVIAALENALDARRQRILLSQSEVNAIKWISLIIQAVCTLTAIAMVHSDNRTGSRIALGLFATAIAVCVLLITAHDRPFIGQTGVPPTALLQVQPGSSVETDGR